MRAVQAGRRHAIRKLLSFALGFAWLACGEASEPEPLSPLERRAAQPLVTPDGRILVIGVDGAEQRLVDRMISEGRLPNLAAIKNAGGSGAARPRPPLLSPRIWTSVVTGKYPENHGVRGWVRVGDDGAPYLYTSRDRHARALWNILSAADKKVGVVNWLMTHPPEAVNGAMVTDHAVEGMADEKLNMANRFASNMKGVQGKAKHDSSEAISYVYPPAFEARVESPRHSGPLTSIPNPFRDRSRWPEEGLNDFMRRVYENDEFAARVALEIEAEYRPDLLMVYLPGIDRISHFLWHSVEPPGVVPEHMLWPAEIEKIRSDAVLAYYDYVDALIGRLMANRGPGDLVVVMSDHGFEVDVSGEEVRNIHESPAARDGILFVRGPGVPVGRHNLVFRMIDMAPTYLAWLGLPPSADMDGRPARWMRVPVPTLVENYEDVPIERLGESSPEVDSRIIDNLKELGYVE